MRFRRLVISSSVVAALWLVLGLTSWIMAEFFGDMGVYAKPVAGGREVVSLGCIDAAGSHTLSLYAPGIALRHWSIMVFYRVPTRPNVAGSRELLGVSLTNMAWAGCSGVGIYWPVPVIVFSLPAVATLAWRRYTSRKKSPGTCARCGYDLTANTSGICPECGESVKPACKPPPSCRLYVLFGMAIGTPTPGVVLAMTQFTPFDITDRAGDVIPFVSVLGLIAGGIIGWAIARRKVHRYYRDWPNAAK